MAKLLEEAAQEKSLSVLDKIKGLRPDKMFHRIVIFVAAGLFPKSGVIVEGKDMQDPPVLTGTAGVEKTDAHS